MPGRGFHALLTKTARSHPTSAIALRGGMNIHRIAGMNEMRRVRETIEGGIAQGLHLGAQVYVSLHGQTIMDEGIGEARHGVRMRTDSISWWLSACKPVAAVGIAILWERGKLDLDDRVATFIPEFGVNGKQSITIRHLLTHTGGFRAVVMSAKESWDNAVAKIAAARIETGWTVGATGGYHVATGWIILAEIIRRIDGRTYDRFAREAVFLPLGMNDSWIGMSREAADACDDRIVTMYATDKRPPNPDQLPPGKEELTAVRPWANGRGPIRELGRFYEMMLNKGSIDAGSRLLRPQTVEAMTARHRTGVMDKTFNHVIDFGLGLIVNSNQYGADTVPYGYGPHASARAFGHSGNQSSCAFADPGHGLAVAWTCNGMAGEIRHNARQRAINAAIYQDLGLVD